MEKVVGLLYLFVIDMLTNYLARTYHLTTRLAQNFAKFDRSKPHVNGRF
jgi:hypothetical protein